MKNLKKLLALLLVMTCLCGTGSTVLATSAPAAPAASARTVVSKASSGNKKVWIATDHGKKYHATKKCWTLKNSKHLKKLKLSEAKKKGYKSPCKVCYK